MVQEIEMSNKEQFDYCMNEQKIVNLKWFFGFGLNCL